MFAMLRPLLFLLVFGLLLPACGGSGGEDGGGGGPPSSEDDPPTIELLAPEGRSALLPGDVLTVVLRADDDRGATIRVLLDGDGFPETAEDQITIYSGPDTAGATRAFDLPTAGVPVGNYTLLAEADDGEHPPVVTPLGGVVLFYPGHAGVAPPRSNAYGTVARFAALSVGEAEDGGVVHNGDGQADDGVIGFLDLTTGDLQWSGRSVDVTSQGPAGTPRILSEIQNTMAWDLLEADEGQFLNGDFDQLDPMVAVARPLFSISPTLVGLGSMRLVPTRSGTHWFGFMREPANAADVNGDGDALDDAYAVIDLHGIASPYFMSPAAGSPFVAATLQLPNAYLVDEAIQGPGNLGVDLRGDGDTSDLLLTFGNGLGWNLGLAGSDPSLMPVQLARNVGRNTAFDTSSTGYLAYYIDEAATGMGPLNGDADATDFVPAIYSTPGQWEALPGFALNAGGAARYCFCSGSVCVYTAQDEAPFDRNGDGDLLDLEVLHWTDAAGNVALANLVSPGTQGLAGIALDGGSAARLDADWVSAVVSEIANATDLNGDGDQLDQVLFLLDISSAPVRVFNTGLVPLPAGAVPLGTIPATGVGGDDGVLFQCAESANGDLNGDMDTSDTLLFFVKYTAPDQPVALENTGALHAANRGGVLAVTADEQLTGSDLNGDGDTFDVLFRAFDLSGNPLGPGQPASRIAIPASADGAGWIYLREESTEGRDLNGDGDLIDVIYGIWVK